MTDRSDLFDLPRRCGLGGKFIADGQNPRLYARRQDAAHLGVGFDVA